MSIISVGADLRTRGSSSSSESSTTMGWSKENFLIRLIGGGDRSSPELLALKSISSVLTGLLRSTSLDLNATRRGSSTSGALGPLFFGFGRDFFPVIVAIAVLEGPEAGGILDCEG